MCRKNFENRSAFGKVGDKNIVAFFRDMVYLIYCVLALFKAKVAGL